MTTDTTTGATTESTASPTLAAVRARGRLRVGVSTGIKGLSWTDEQGVRRGLDVDTARAVAAAVLGDADAVDYVELTPEQRMPSLADGSIDLLSCNATWTLTRECGAGAVFLPTTAYDGGAFMVKKSTGITEAAQLAGRKLAVLGGTSSAASLDAYYGPQGLEVTAVPFDTPAEALAAYADGSVDGYVCDRIVLAGERTRIGDPDDHVILEETISNEPMGPAVRDDDPAWLRVNRWVFFALVAAEAEGLTAAGVAAGTPSALLDRQAGLGAAAGLPATWIQDAVGQVGNYGEIYDRNLGDASGLGIPRGLNDLWLRGGLIYAPPLA
ncbi:amino acid ABC transporter substrate-binding protein [Streptomyces sp. NPDC007251]|uniref:amino acid ABC transporter substrate-binding protein n=1 Tax=unclassified Streptomyces TaxID=2593676 RepID=UPI0033FF9411